VRLDRLDLLRYGAFTGRSLVLAPAGCDMQIVFGQNEAGKSTMRAALEDLLFGIEHKTQYNFLHANHALRLGGGVSHAGQRLEFRRRKGNRDTLLNPADEPLSGGEVALAPFLNGVTKGFLIRMFALTHQRLREGGQEMLDAKGEAGQAIFSAGTGLADLRQRMRALEAEADALWAPRQSGKRAWYEAKAAMDAAAKQERECTMTATKLQESTRALGKAKDECDRLEKERKQARQKQSKLVRIRRVYRNVQSLAAVDRELAEIGAESEFPEEASARLNNALQAHRSAQASIDTLTNQIDQAKKDRDSQVLDEELLARAEDVAILKQQRIEVQKEKMDLPQRRAELTNAQKQLIGEAEQLGWLGLGPDDIINRIPGNSRVAAATQLATRRGALETAVTAARAALDEAVDGCTDLQATLDALPPASDVAALAAQLTAMRAADDPAARVVAAERERREAQAAIDRLLATLDPAINTAEQLETLRVPPIDTISAKRDQIHAAQQQARDCARSVAAKEREVGVLQAKLQRRVDDERVVTPEVLGYARAVRDAGWKLVRARYIDTIDVSEADVAAFQGGAQDLPQAFEQKACEADALADQRFEKAQAAGELAVLSGQLAASEIELRALKDAKDAAEQAMADQQKDWNALWAPCGFEPHDPDVMWRWMDAREDAIDALQRRQAAERALEEAHGDVAAARASLVDELGRVASGHAKLDGKTLGALVEFASSVQQEHARRADLKRDTETQIRKATADMERKREVLSKAEQAHQEWQVSWSTTLTELQLPPATKTEAALAMFEGIATLRGLAATITNLRTERIAKMERDIAGFDETVAAFVATVANDLAGRDPSEAVVKLEQRLEKVRDAKTAQESADKHITSLTHDLKKAQDEQYRANEVVSGLRQISGSADLEHLKAAMQRAAHAITLRGKKIELAQTIVNDGDGHTLDELCAECTGVDLDAATAKEAEIETALRVIEEQLAPAIKARIEAEQALNAIGEGDAAAQAAARREEALTDMRSAAERYVRARAAVVMLQWAIDRYQHEKQAPLLQRATTLFANLTNGSFVGVRTEFDDLDRAKLVGVRADESVVDVTGMSDGTADQLYLALRLAAIYEYIEHSPPMPVIADDLLVNFDNERATAGLKVLAELARHTQVVFFTHHRHLLEIAQSTLGEDLHVATWA